jgi:multidrug efflux pump
VPKVVDKLKTVPEITGVNTDRDNRGLQVDVVIDRIAASRLGVRIQDIDAALNNAFSQRQISTIYNQRNQYRVILETDPRFQRDPTDIGRVYVPGKDNTQIPLSSVARFERGLAPLVVNHQGQFPAVTVSYELAEGVVQQEASDAIDQAVAELHMPETVRGDFAGDTRAARRSGSGQGLLILAALLAVYIVLGVLYESLLHPLTIISTLPPAGLGALLALQMFKVDLSLIAFIGIILLIGLVKKNGIMLVDFALEGERRRGLTPERAVTEACIARFRPILMTTLAAILGALPLVLATGQGSEVRRPLGITIIGGLLVSQFLTLYTTPAIYLMLERLRQRWARRRGVLPQLPPGTVTSAPS